MLPPQVIHLGGREIQHKMIAANLLDGLTRQTHRRLEGTKLGGLITTAVGIGLMIFLGIANDDNHLIGVAIGVVPLMVGLALLLYAYRFAPKSQQP